MKKLLFVTMGLLISIIACQKKDDGGGGGTIAQTPPPQTQTNCNIPGANPAACNPNYYNQNGWPYTYAQGGAYGGSGGFCGCPAGTIPTMNWSWGVGCAPMNYSASSYGYSGWDYPASNTQVLNQPPPSYYTAPRTFAAQNGNNCFPFAAQACNVSIAGSCGQNSVCVASSAGASLGVCQYAATFDSNNFNDNCQQKNWGGFSYWSCTYLNTYNR